MPIILGPAISFQAALADKADVERRICPGGCVAGVLSSVLFSTMSIVNRDVLQGLLRSPSKVALCDEEVASCANVWLRCEAGTVGLQALVMSLLVDVGTYSWD